MSFRICTIGCGGMATLGHGPSYARYAAEHPDTELAACCDLDPEKAAAFRERFGFAHSDTDFDAMLDREKPDAICLVAPVEMTCELACRILARGIPLLLEKPPGTTVAECDRMIEAAERSGAATQVAFNRRYMPLIALLQQRLAGKTLQHLHCEFTRVGRPDADFSLTAIHGIDAIRFLAGGDYRRIRFLYQELPAFGPTVANMHLLAEMESGATATLSFCPVAGETAERITGQAEGDSFHLRLPVWGSPDIPGRLIHRRKNELLLDVPCPAASLEGEMSAANGFYAENAAFFDAVRGGLRLEGDLRNARQSLEVAQCLRERRAEYRLPGA